MRFGRQTRQKSNGKEKDQEIPEGIQSIPTQAHSGSVWYSNHFRIIGIFVPETKTEFCTHFKQARQTRNEN